MAQERRQGGASPLKIYIVYLDTPLGRLSLAADDNNLVAAWLACQKGFRPSPETNVSYSSNPVLELASSWFRAYFRGEKPDAAEIPVSFYGSPFQVEVWNLLRAIPYGTLATYGGLANIIAKRRNLPKMSAQAVGGAVGRNPVAILAPCHRVIGKNGKLTGYGGGIDVKIKLLELEGIDTAKLKRPKIL